MGPTSPGPSLEPAPSPIRLDTLYGAISPVLTGFLLYLRVPEQDVDDLAQEVRLTIFQEARRNPPLNHPIHRWMRSDAGAAQHLHRWVRSIATHAVLNYRTKSYRRREKLSPDGVVPAVGNGRSPARHAADAERIRVLIDLLDELAEPLRDVLVMHYFERSTTEAIAQALGIPQGTVFSRLRQAREELKAAVRRTLRDGHQLLLTTEDLDTWLPDPARCPHGTPGDPADDGTSNRSWLALFTALLRLGGPSTATGTTPARSISKARPMLLLGPIGLAGGVLIGTCSSPPDVARTMPLISPVPVQSDDSPAELSCPLGGNPLNRSLPPEHALPSQDAGAPLDSAALPPAIVTNDIGWPPLFVGAPVPAPSHERTPEMKPNALIPPMIAVCMNGSGCGEAAVENTSGEATNAGPTLCVPGEAKPCYSGPASTEGVGICRAGVTVCNHDGASWGPCLGESRPAPESCATQTDDDCDGMAPVCSGDLRWGKTFEGGLTEIPFNIIMDSAGGMLLAGTVDSYIVFGEMGGLYTEGNSDMFVVKFNPTGSYLWFYWIVGSSTSKPGMNIASDSQGNLALLGHFNGGLYLADGVYVASAGLHDIFIAKLDASGGYLWSRSFGDGADQLASAVAADSEGNIVITGSFGGTLDFGGSPLTSAGYDIFLAKFDLDGNHLWSRRFGDIDPQVDALQEATGVAIDADGNIFLTGRFAGTSTFGGSPLTSAGGADVFVTKLDPAGNHLWSKRFGYAHKQTPRALAVDASGNVWLTGEFAGTLDFGGGALAGAGDMDVFVAKLDGSGNHVFSNRFGDSGHQAAGSIIIDAAGHVILIGDFNGTIQFGSQTLTSVGPSDVYVAKLDGSGHPVWSKQFPGNGIGRSIASDAAGNIAAVGNFRDTIDLGSGPSASTGERDIFLVKLAP